MICYKNREGERSIRVPAALWLQAHYFVPFFFGPGLSLLAWYFWIRLKSASVYMGWLPIFSSETIPSLAIMFLICRSETPITSPTFLGVQFMLLFGLQQILGLFQCQPPYLLLGQIIICLVVLLRQLQGIVVVYHLLIAGIVGEIGRTATDRPVLPVLESNLYHTTRYPYRALCFFHVSHRLFLRRLNLCALARLRYYRDSEIMSSYFFRFAEIFITLFRILGKGVYGKKLYQFCRVPRKVAQESQENIFVRPEGAILGGKQKSLNYVVGCDFVSHTSINSERQAKPEKKLRNIFRLELENLSFSTL